MRQSLPYQALELPRVILVLVFLVVAVWYLSWRLGTFNPDALTFSVLLYSAEVYGFSTTLMHLFMAWRLSVRARRPCQPLPPGACRGERRVV